MATTLIIEPKALPWHRTESSSYWIISILNPFFWKTAVILSVVEWFQRKPVCLVCLRIFIVDPLFMNII